MANGNSPAVPGWLQPVTQVITTLGIPTVFAAVLLWFVLTRLDTALRVIMDNEDARTVKLTAIEQGFVTTLDRQTVSFTAAIQSNIAAIDRQTQMFQASIKENIDAIHENNEISRQMATALQRMQARPDATP